MEPGLLRSSRDDALQPVERLSEPVLSEEIFWAALGAFSDEVAEHIACLEREIETLRTRGGLSRVA
jgi:hypothetical protein